MEQVGIPLTWNSIQPYTTPCKAIGHGPLAVHRPAHFLLQPDFLQWHPLMCFESCVSIFGRKAFGFRSSIRSTASLRTESYSWNRQAECARVPRTLDGTFDRHANVQSALARAGASVCMRFGCVKWAGAPQGARIARVKSAGPKGTVRRAEERGPAHCGAPACCSSRRTCRADRSAARRQSTRSTCAQQRAAAPGAQVSMLIHV